MSLDGVTEEILMSKYDSEKTIFEKYIEKHFDSKFMQIISNLILSGKNFKEILLYKIEDKYIFEYLEEHKLNSEINYLLVANDENVALDLIKKGYDRILEYVFNRNILAMNITDDESVLNRIIRRLPEDSIINKELKNEFIKFDLSLNFNELESLMDLDEELFNSDFDFPLWIKVSFFSYKFNKVKLSTDKMLESCCYGLSLIDLLLMSNMSVPKLDELAKTNPTVASYYVKYQRFDVFEDASLLVLTTKIGDKSILDYLYSNVLYNQNYSKTKKNNIWNNIREKATKSKEIAKIAFDNYDYLKALQNEDFLLDNSYGSSEKNLDLVIKELLDNNELDLLCFIKKSGKLLTYKSKNLDNQMIIEYITNNFKNDFYYALIPIETWLHITDEGISLLEFMITRDRELTIKTIEQIPNAFSNIRITTILIANGINPPNLDIHLNEEDRLSLKEIYAEPIYKIRYDREFSEEEKAAIETLKIIMMTDGNSDIEVIELACNSFREQFANGNAYAMRDLQSLINIKRQYPKFSLKKYTSGSSFNKNEEILYIDNSKNIDVFNHELTHVIHWYATQYSVPSNFFVFDDLNLEQTNKILQYAKLI